MNQILYKARCRCNEEFLITKKSTVNKRSEGKSLQYPKLNEIGSKSFYILYDGKLSSVAKLSLNCFNNKYFYYAIDDIYYSFQLNVIERNNLLAILYSPIISLQNNFSINFFDIWIHEIYIDETAEINKFFNSDSQNLEQKTYITIKLLYKTRLASKKENLLW